MILARCPHCDTTFRAAPEALKVRSGQVRCGQCQKVFNALDHLVTETPPPPNLSAPPAFLLTPPPAPPATEAATATQDALPVTDEPEANDATDAVPESAAVEVVAFDEHPLDTAASEPHSFSDDPVDEAAIAEASDAITEANEANEATETPAIEFQDPLFDSPNSEQIAARDTREVPGYSKWAEGTLSAPSIAFEEPRRTAWISVVSVVVLTLMMLVQIAHYWRVDIANRWPSTRPWLEEACASFDCTVPYPRDASQINLEASELQIDPERGNMLVLNMTLKNRAAFAQHYPAIELTLTDARDNVVVRRILPPGEWLPDHDKTLSTVAFPANKEIAARLWIDAKDTGAVGYRLFVFYP